jgi:hypothetical protein
MTVTPTGAIPSLEVSSCSMQIGMGGNQTISDGFTYGPSLVNDECILKIYREAPMGFN